MRKSAALPEPAIWYNMPAWYLQWRPETEWSNGATFSVKIKFLEKTSFRETSHNSTNSHHKLHLSLSTARRQVQNVIQIGLLTLLVQVVEHSRAAHVETPSRRNVAPPLATYAFRSDWTCIAKIQAHREHPEGSLYDTVLCAVSVVELVERCECTNAIFSTYSTWVCACSRNTPSLIHDRLLRMRPCTGDSRLASK